MKQLQFYKYAALGLFLLNFLMITFFFITKPKPPHQEGGFQKKAVDILKMDEQQHDTFLQFVKQHQRQMEEVNKQQRDLLKPYFYSLSDSTNKVDTESTLDRVQLLERKKIESTYQHFQDVKSILKPEQQAGFEEFMNTALERILLDKQRNSPPPKGF